MEVHLVRPLLAFIILSLSNHINPSNATLANEKANIEYVRKSCKVAPHPKLCYSSLKQYAGKINSDPKLLTFTALNVTLEVTKQSFKTVKVFSETHDLNPAISLTLGECGKKLTEAVTDIEKGTEELEDGGGPSEGSSSPSQDVVSSQQWLNQAWLSAVQTIETSCLDALAAQRFSGRMEMLTRRYIKKVVYLTNNALGILKAYAETQVTDTHP